MAKRISIINFKGGVGKTTLAFHFGAGLARFHAARVLLIDMDHQSSLSIVCLGTERWSQATHKKLTVDAIFQPFVNDSASLPGDEIIIRDPMRKPYPKTYDTPLNNFYPYLHIVPADFTLDDTEINLTASHRGEPIKSDWDKRTYICRWIEETGIDNEYDYIIFDCPPATKIVAQNAIAASHGYIIPVVPEAVMERGAPHLRGTVKSGIDARLIKLAESNETVHRTMHVRNSQLFGLVVTRIQSANSYSGYTNDHDKHLRTLKKYWGEDLLKPYIKKGVGVSESLSAGWPVYDRTGVKNIERHDFPALFAQLTVQLKQRIDHA